MDRSLPGAELIERGLADLDRGVESIESLLVAIGARRLREAGIAVGEAFASPEHRLYQLLAERIPIRRTRATTRSSGAWSASSGLWNA